MHLLSPFSLNLPLYEHKKRPSYYTSDLIGERVASCTKVLVSRISNLQWNLRRHVFHYYVLVFIAIFLFAAP